MGVQFSDPSAEPEETVSRAPQLPSAAIGEEEIDESGDTVTPSEPAGSQPAPELDRDESREALVRRLSADGEESEDDDTGEAEAVEELEAEDPETPSAPDAETPAEDPEATDPVDNLAENTQKRIRTLVSQRNEARERLAQYEEREAQRKQMGIPDKDWDAWLAMGRAVHHDPAKARDNFVMMAKNLGWTPETQVQREVLDLSDDSEIMSKLEDLEESGELTHSALRTIRKALKASVKTGAPAPAQPAPAPAAPTSATAVDPSVVQDQAVRSAILARVTDESRTLYPNEWNDMAVQVQAQLDMYGYIPTDSLENITRAAVKSVYTERQMKALQEQVAKKAPPKKTVRTGLRPSAGTPPAAEPKTRPEARSQLADRLHGGR